MTGKHTNTGSSQATEAGSRSAGDATTHKVVVVFKRVQTFLFASAQLRDMVGANVLLGETLRNDLVRCALDCESGLPSRLPAAIVFDRTGDPLEAAAIADEYRDRPDDLLAKGILARDGGHFGAIFPSRPAADRFVQAAQGILARQLPELPYSIAVTPFPRPVSKTTATSGSGFSPQVYYRAVPELPPLRVCEALGNGTATCRDPTRDEWISDGIDLRRQARGRFVDTQGGTCDMVGLMHDRLPFSTVPPPTDFDRLCGDGGYLALIHADGNSIGRRIAERQAACGHAKGTLGYEAATEQWFHRMRVAMRQALVTALTRTYAGATDKDYQFRPYQFLMLGGDDVLLACRAADALRLVRDLCLALDDDALRMIDGDPLTLGIGVAIARPSFPLYRLHAVAESLAASAKRLFRQRDALQLPRRSVVDWSIVTASWTDDPLALRRERDLVERDCEVLALSARPYPVVGVADGKGALDNLVGLLAAAEAVGESKAARSQWQQLALDLRRGRHWGELRMRELPAETRAAFAAVGIDSPWIPLGAEHGQPGGRGRWLTPLLDLIEMIEIRQLGRTVASAEGEEG